MDPKALASLKKALKNRITDRFETGDVIRWTSNGRYTYAVVKDGRGLWTITGAGSWYGKGSFTFDELVDVLNRSEVSDVVVATGWESIG